MVNMISSLEEFNERVELVTGFASGLESELSKIVDQASVGRDIDPPSPQKLKGKTKRFVGKLQMCHCSATCNCK